MINISIILKNKQNNVDILCDGYLYWIMSVGINISGKKSTLMSNDNSFSFKYELSLLELKDLYWLLKSYKAQVFEKD